MTPRLIEIPADVQREVVRWTLAAHDRRDVVEAIKAKWPDVDADAAIESAREEIADNANEDPRAALGYAIGAARELIRQMNAAGDFAGALRGVKMLAELSDKLAFADSYIEQRAIEIVAERELEKKKQPREREQGRREIERTSESAESAEREALRRTEEKWSQTHTGAKGT